MQPIGIFFVSPVLAIVSTINNPLATFKARYRDVFLSFFSLKSPQYHDFTVERQQSIRVFTERERERLTLDERKPFVCS